MSFIVSNLLLYFHTNIHTLGENVQTIFITHLLIPAQELQDAYNKIKPKVQSS